MTAAAAQVVNLVILGTIWALTRFLGYSIYPITIYQSGRWFLGEKEAKKNGKRTDGP